MFGHSLWKLFAPINKRTQHFYGCHSPRGRNVTIYFIIIHTELLVAKIKSCIPKLCDKEGNIFSILPGQYFFNIARTLCDQSVPKIGYAPPTLVTVATSHKLSLSCDDKMAAGSHPRSLDSKMTHKALYE